MKNPNSSVCKGSSIIRSLDTIYTVKPKFITYKESGETEPEKTVTMDFSGITVETRDEHFNYTGRLIPKSVYEKKRKKATASGGTEIPEKKPKFISINLLNKPYYQLLDLEGNEFILVDYSKIERNGRSRKEKSIPLNHEDKFKIIADSSSVLKSLQSYVKKYMQPYDLILKLKDEKPPSAEMTKLIVDIGCSPKITEGKWQFSVELLDILDSLGNIPYWTDSLLEGKIS